MVIQGYLTHHFGSSSNQLGPQRWNLYYFLLRLLPCSDFLPQLQKGFRVNQWSFHCIGYVVQRAGSALADLKPPWLV